MKRSALLLISAVACGCGAPAAPPANPPTAAGTAAPAPAQEKPIRVDSAAGMWRAYGENPAAADLKYTGRRVEFDDVGVVGKDENGYFFSVLVIANPPDGSAPSLICRVPPGGASALASLKPSDVVRVSGLCRGGSRSPDAFNGYAVTLDDCRISKVPKP